MIQRIQSVYLLLVTILLVVAICLPVGQFIGSDGIATHVFKPLGVTLADGSFQSTWGLFGILLLSAIIAASSYDDIRQSFTDRLLHCFLCIHVYFER